MIQDSATLTVICSLNMNAFAAIKLLGSALIPRGNLKGDVYEKNHRFTSLSAHAGACLLVCSKSKSRRNDGLG